MRGRMVGCMPFKRTKASLSSRQARRLGSNTNVSVKSQPPLSSSSRAAIVSTGLKPAGMLRTFTANFFLSGLFYFPDEFFQRTAAVGNLVFDFVAEFGKGLLIAFGDENRIVAESFVAARFFGNFAVNPAFKQLYLLVGAASAMRRRNVPCGFLCRIR